MKIVCFLICVVTLFSSCTAKSSGSQYIITQKNDSDSSIYVHNLFDGTGLGNEDGYYYIEVQESGVQNIKYVDYASRKEMYLCSRPECSHCDETCTSVVIPYGGTVIVFPYNNYIYLLYSGSTKNSEYYEKYGDKALPHLERRDLDGMNGKNIFTLSANEVTEGNIAFIQKEIYLTIKSVEEENGKLVTKYYLNKYNIETGNCISEYLLDKTCRGIIAANKDNLVMEFINDNRRELAKIKYTYSKFNILDNSILNIAEVNPRNTNAFVIGDILYIVDTSENSLTGYSITTLDKNAITDKLTNKYARGGVFCHTNDGIVLLSYTDDEFTAVKEYYEFKTNSTKEIQIETRYEENYTSDAPLILAENEQYYLIVIDNFNENKGYFNVDGSVVVFQGPEYVKALITKDDYIQGKANYTIIENLE